ncbi:MAG: START domain-containing protein [Bacteroidota bacterium]
MYSILVLILSLNWISPSESPGEEDWKKAKDKDGITIYTRGSELTRVKEFKAIASINAPISTILNVFWDAESSCEWVQGCQQSEVIEAIPGKSLKYYMEIRVPFPFHDRDLIQSFLFEKIDKKKVRVHLKNLPDDLERRKKLIRLEIAEGEWILEKISENETRATLKYLSDPGGSIPAWLTNLFIVDGSFGYMEGLRKMVKKDKYQDNKTWDF